MVSVSSSDVMQQLRALGLSDGELAARAGLARETVARWRSGTQKPSLDALEALASAAGAQLEVRVVQADPEYIALVGDQVRLGYSERVEALLGHRAWPHCRSALRAAAALGDLAVLIGPVAAAISGSPQRPGNGRVDVLVAAEDQEEAFERLLAADVQPDGIEAAPGDVERRERWSAGDGRLTLRTAAAGTDLSALRRRARAMAMEEGIGIVHVALVEDLLDIAINSPWQDDQAFIPGLRAVLASGLYSTREARSATAA
jgi:transcriptional regulator with XRE-family HTH domain